LGERKRGWGKRKTQFERSVKKSTVRIVERKKKLPKKSTAKREPELYPKSTCAGREGGRKYETYGLRR